jgi:hypothetical protein
MRTPDFPASIPSPALATLEVSMSRMKRVALLSFASAVLTFGLLFSSACGGGSTTSQPLSTAQAQAISQEFAEVAEAALQGSITGATRERENFSEIFAESVKHGASSSASSGCVTSLNGTTCNFPVSYSGNCPQGGSIGVSGDLDFTLNDSGDGSDNSSLTITPTNCVVSNVTINGDPNVTFATQVTFQNDNLAYPVTLNETGGISYGPNPSGSCTVNATLTISSPQSCTVSGTICGQTLSGSCVPLPPDTGER